MMTDNMNHLIKEIRHQLDLMRNLHDISVDISSRLDIQHVLNVVVKQAALLLNAQGSTLAVCEPETNLARVVALHNIPLEYEELVLRPGASTASHVLTTGKPLIINNLGQWASRHKEMEDDRDLSQFYDAILAVPLIWEGKVTGSLVVMDRGIRRPFNNNDKRVLGLLANLAGAALHNAHLYSQVLQLNQQLERKVEQRTKELAHAQDKLAAKAEELQRVLGITVFLQEEERTRIARDLHDSSNQLVTGALYEIQAAQQSLEGQRYQTAMAKLDKAKGLLRQIDAENRRLIADLRPPVLDNYGLVAALRKLAENCQESCGALCTIKISGEPIRLSSRVETTIYRIMQECLNNIVLHSYAQEVAIGIDFDSSGLRILVEDDGVGFDADIAAAKNRIGVIGMRERAQSIKGRLSLWSQPSQGTRLFFELPLPVHEEEGDNLSKMSPSYLAMKNPKYKRRINKKEMYLWGKGDDYSNGGKGENLSNRNQESLPELIAAAIEELEEAKALTFVQEAIDGGIEPFTILNGVMDGLKIIGHKFETRFYYLGELLTGAKLAEACLNILDPHLPKGSNARKGVIVIGAVQGDIHSIGYELVSRQLELAGYEVHKLGVNVPTMAFIDKAQKIKADIIALSAFLVTTIPYCSELLHYLEDMGLRERYKVIIGGSETSADVARVMGADGWAADALDAVKLCDRLLQDPGYSGNP